jgi:hypothetical protein
MDTPNTMTKYLQKVRIINATVSYLYNLTLPMDAACLEGDRPSDQVQNIHSTEIDGSDDEADDVVINRDYSYRH